ncbi:MULTISPECIES: hypothetical protein [unclassified Streptomyces]|nr:hypothetical protein [Streptomyces sp. CNQ-509]
MAPPRRQPPRRRDCHAARQILQEIANGRGTAFTPRKPEPSTTAP